MAQLLKQFYYKRKIRRFVDALVVAETERRNRHSIRVMQLVTLT